MKLNKLLVLILLVSMVFDCESPLKTKDDVARITININFPENLVKDESLQKTSDINIITIIVESSDMDRISKDFQVNSQRIECNLEVPKGDNRLFKVQGKDASNVIQFSGQTREDITNSSETIIINDLVLIAPQPVPFSFSEIGETGFVINWSKSTAPDFSHYRVLVGTDPNLNLENNKVGNDIHDPNNTSMTITGANPGTVYFVAVVVFDTENYFGGMLEFETDGSIVKRIETSDVLSIPDPVDVGIMNITSTTFELIWSKSYAPNFNFYRVLVSPNMILDPDADKVGDDINNADMRSMTISNLNANSIYYTAVLSVNDEMEFSGILEYGQENSIVHQVTTADQIILGYDDDNFENSIYSTTVGTRYMNGFARPAPSTYVKEVWLYLVDTSNEDNNYRIVICDAGGNVKFYSNPLPTTYGNEWVGWDIPWENENDGYMDEQFYVGIEYTKNIGWPEVGLDQSSDYESGFYIENEIWYTLADINFSGNLGIRVAVEVAGEGWYW